jgi:hypothetical protein
VLVVRGRNEERCASLKLNCTKQGQTSKIGLTPLPFVRFDGHGEPPAISAPGPGPASGGYSYRGESRNKPPYPYRRFIRRSDGVVVSWQWRKMGEVVVGWWCRV